MLLGTLGASLLIKFRNLLTGRGTGRGIYRDGKGKSKGVLRAGYGHPSQNKTDF